MKKFPLCVFVLFVFFSLCCYTFRVPRLQQKEAEAEEKKSIGKAMQECLSLNAAPGVSIGSSAVLWLTAPIGVCNGSEVLGSSMFSPAAVGTAWGTSVCFDRGRVECSDCDHRVSFALQT